jgi:LmbE family N-acetylglucosaminyl deacetylase
MSGTRAGPVLAVFAHPDDAEMAAGGTLARFAAEGRPTHLLILTNGDRGSQDPATDRAALARTRVTEQEAASRVLGLESFRILANHDGDLVNDQQNRTEVARSIRTVQPSTLITCDPTTWVLGSSYYYYNHPDHRVAGEIALDTACYGAGNPLYFSDLLDEGLDPWNVRDILLAWTEAINHHQDVTGYLEAKLRALEQHQSQVGADQYGDFRDWIPRAAAKQGRRAGTTHAEAFRHLVLR